jgi:hypothetical protein
MNTNYYLVLNANKKFSDFSLSYDGSALKICSRFTEGATEIRQPSKYRIIQFENFCN